MLDRQGEPKVAHCEDLTTRENLIALLEHHLWYMGDHAVPQRHIPRDVLQIRSHETLNQLKAQKGSES